MKYSYSRWKRFFAGIVLTGMVQAQAQRVPMDNRVVLGLNEAWKFTKDSLPATNNQAAWESVTLPHTWNKTDVMDDVPGYYRGACWYKKQLHINSSFAKKQVFLYFEGANQETEVYVNGKKAGVHIGGYTAFCIPITGLLHFDGADNTNEISVLVNNRFNESVPPLSADFTFYGGLYRDVFLIATDAVHFSVTDRASSGVYLTTPAVSEKTASLHIAGKLVNESANSRQLQVVTTLMDNMGESVGETRSSLSVKAGEEVRFNQDIPAVAQPHLWRPEDPFLYTAVTKITEAKSGRIVDQVTNPVGFRWFRFDADKGFFLNGKSYKLIGTSRHQDYKGLGNAVPDELARQDVRLLKDMGGNFLRVAHYPQDPSVLALCDQLGILASVEIPLVNEITESEAFYSNCEQMQVEMIRQNFNHPSVVIWAYMNEILLRPKYNNDKAKQKIYFGSIAQLAKRLDSLTRKEDPSRYTMISNHGDFNRYQETGLTRIPMIVGWNLYNGWYNSVMEGFSTFMDKHHKELPDKPVIITEYGADADPRIRSFNAERFDKSVEYTTVFHQYYLTEILKRPFVAGGAVWNLADFNSETREETMPHMNNKGLLTYDRIPKDPFYYYKAKLVDTPFIKIASSYWTLRGGVATAATPNSCTQPLQVATNVDTVELFVNGQSLGKNVAENNICQWMAPFINGENNIRAVAVKGQHTYTDCMTILFRLQPDDLKNTKVPFQQMNIMLGAKRFYLDEGRKEIWLPDQAYRPGSWGYIGGAAFRVNNGRQTYGTDKSIAGTDDDPVYQTQQVGIEQYRIDVGQGQYELTLHFAELEGTGAMPLPYNLSPAAGQETTKNRIFDVYVNGNLVLENFDLARQYGTARAIAKKIPVYVQDGEGIEVIFKAKEGKPVLNALQLKKLY
jgi:beta-galactosidase